MSVLLVLAVSAASILGSITEIGVRNLRARQGRVSIERLAGVFRDDVHQASRIDVPATRSSGDSPAAETPADDTSLDDALLVQMTFGKETVHYRWDARQHAVTRIASEGEQRRSSDRFPLADGCNPELSSRDGIVALVLKQGPNAKLKQPWVIEARQ